MGKMRIYVGTYHKYNSGSIEGKWMDLDDYADAKEFYAACKELHKDEQDPELMFQDWEGIPERLAGECMDIEDVYDYRDNMDKASNPEAFEVYVDQMSGDYDNFDEAYQGEYDSEEDFADELASELGYYKAMRDAGLNESYFDLERFARDLFISDYTFVDGYVFRDL